MKKRNIITIITLIFIYVCLFIICRCNLFSADDYNYSNISWTTQKLLSFQDIFESCKSMYHNWTGRMPVMFITHSALYLGTLSFDVLNPIVFILFICLIIKISVDKINTKNIFWILFLIICCTLKFWEKYIWLSGSFNYLWTVTLMLIVIYNYNQIFFEEVEFKNLRSAFFIIVSFLAGWSHENTAFVLGSYILASIFLNLKRIKNLKIKQKIVLFISIISFGIGAILLIFCPGNFSRMNIAGGFGFFQILKNIIALGIVIGIYLITIIIMKKSKKIKNDINVNEMLTFQFKTYVIPIIISILPMIILSEFPIRAALAYEVMLYIAILHNINIINETYNKFKLLRIIEITMIVLSSTILILKVGFSVIYLSPYKQKIFDQIDTSKESGIEDIIISEFDNIRMARLIGVFNDEFPKNNYDSIINTYMSNYYNVKSITAVKDGFVQIEINTNNENELKKYIIQDRKTGKVLGERITEIELPLPEKTLNNRIIFEIKIDDLKNAYIKLPESVKKDIIDIKLRSIEKIDDINLNTLINQ